MTLVIMRLFGDHGEIYWHIYYKRSLFKDLGAELIYNISGPFGDHTETY